MRALKKPLEKCQPGAITLLRHRWAWLYWIVITDLKETFSLRVLKRRTCEAATPFFFFFFFFCLFFVFFSFNILSQTFGGEEKEEESRNPCTRHFGCLRKSSPFLLYRRAGGTEWEWPCLVVRNQFRNQFGGKIKKKALKNISRRGGGMDFSFSLFCVCACVCVCVFVYTVSFYSIFWYENWIELPQNIFIYLGD